MLAPTPTIRRHFGGAVTLTFAASDLDFAASEGAERYLEARGFSVGYRQGPSPRGILFGDIAIQKWRNLDAFDRARLHGQMEGDGRQGPITVTIRADAPQEARDAIGAEPGPTLRERARGFADLAKDALAIGTLIFGAALLAVYFGPWTNRRPQVAVTYRDAIPAAPKIRLRAEALHLRMTEARP